MFYSQFILAKKGPLGTIWIAAHLERKLRKNQVADTDIGVSVDSILFPDVPIALRLSSHLLLGVVRIYSRKVNYLFDDCSEALLKIKQAFRSTAVDLPPEESTAPYHSITLPETFDLDDFELPDNEIFQGNYVDHHVSSREQITLQDTMEGIAYSTSQFGLDERFGDGDASQIGLDLDEEMFLGKVAAQGNDEVPDADQLDLAQPMIPEERNDYERISGTLTMMQENGAGVQNEDLAEHDDVPFTPGFMEYGDFDGDMEAKEDNVLESVAAEGTANAKSDAHRGDDNAGDGLLCKNLDNENVGHSEENGYLSGEMEIRQAKQQEHSSSTAMTAENISVENGLCTSIPFPITVEHVKPNPDVPESSNGNNSTMDGPNRVEDIHSGIVINNEPSTIPVDKTDVECAGSPGVRLDETVASPTCSQVTTELEDTGRRTCSNETEVHNRMGESCSPSNALASNVVCPSESPERPEVVNIEVQTFQEPKNRGMASSDLPTLNPCNSLQQSNPSFLAGEGSDTNDVMKVDSERKQISEPALCEKTPDDHRKLDEGMNNAESCDNQLESLDRSVASDLPAPEKLLSAPEELTRKPNDLLVESTPGGDEGDAGINVTTGRKRSFTETTLTVHSLNSNESFDMTRSKKTKTAESIPDDDDLLSSILVGRKSSVLKMKPTPPVPENTSTKRLRSAPRASASKRKVLIDDMMVLHGDTIRQQLTNTEDIRRMRKKAPCTLEEISMIQRQFLEEEIFSEPIFTGMAVELISLYREPFDLSKIRVSAKVQDNVPVDSEKDLEPSELLRNDTEAQPDSVQIQNEIQHDDQHEPLGEMAAMEIDGENVEVTVAANDTVHGIESSFPTDPFSNIVPVSGDIAVQADCMDKNDDVDASMQMDTTCISPKCDTKPVEDASRADLSDGRRDDATEVVEQDSEVGVDVEKVESELASDQHASFVAASEETVGLDNVAFVNGDESAERIENNNLSVPNEDELFASNLGYDDKDLGVDASFSLEFNVDAQAFLNEGVNADFQEADPQSTMNAEVNCGDYEDVAYEHDTEFLNVDDDDIDEDDDDDNMPGAEDAPRLTENSGWSSRTRAVGKYLQTLFDKETVPGNRILPMDNLLTGKTRKEASRMFFETLVLKTRDYINVEQPKPFENINIKPKIKLMKSDF
ncbi:hypothetical protein UlMin_012539 [Ulmus minor]